MDEITVGSRWTKTLLGTTATYEVIEVKDDIVLVEVVSAPGLRAGVRVRLAKSAFSEMRRRPADSQG